MYFSLKLENKNTGRGITGYTVKIYSWSSSTAGYTGTALYTLTDNSDGIYYTDITTTIKGTVVINASGSTSLTIPTHYKGYVFWGDNILTLTPGGSS
jgi:hypothetical protein